LEISLFQVPDERDEASHLFQHGVKMIVRLLSASLVLVAASAGAQEAAILYKPGSAQYRVTTSTNTTQEMNGQKQDFSVNSTQKLTVTVGSARDSLPLTIVLDSIAQQASIPGAPDVSALSGMKLTGTMSPRGRIYSASITGASGSEVSNQQGEGLRRFLPRLPASMKKGATWTDTVDAVLPAANGAELRRTAEVTYTVLGDTAMAGGKAWKVGMESKAKISGKGSQMGTDFTIEGGSTSSGVTYIAPNGWFLGAEGSENQELLVSVEAAGMLIPINSKTKTSVEKIK
jgi:hypothetical protein